MMLSLAFNTPVGRIGDDSDRSTTEATDLDVYVAEDLAPVLPQAQGVATSPCRFISDVERR